MGLYGGGLVGLVFVLVSWCWLRLRRGVDCIIWLIVWLLWLLLIFCYYGSCVL